MGEREDTALAAIKRREAEMIESLRAGASEVWTGQFVPAQLGLRPVYADNWGRMWRDDGGKFTLIWDAPVEKRDGG